MVTCDLVIKKIITVSKTEKKNVVKATSIVINTLKDKKAIVCLPQNIPMIIPPKLYSENQLGGYLLNDEAQNGSVTRLG